MEDMLKAYRSSELEKRISVLNLELDEELEKLYNAMIEKSEKKILDAKDKLSRLRKEMIMLEVL